MTDQTRRFELSDPLYQEVADFLYQEAALLDQNRLREWLGLLNEHLVYLMPVRVNLERAAGAGFVEGFYHFEENLASLTLRVKRLETDHAWAEDPPSRTRRFISNIQVSLADREDELAVTNYILLVRNRGDAPDTHLISAERRDIVRQTPDGLKLIRREILIDQTTVGLENLAIFF